MSASAANWEFAPRAQGGYKYNDNYRLDLPGSEIEVSGVEADAEFLFRTVDPRTRVEIAPRVRATYFPSETEEDSSDYFLRGLFSDTTPRRRTGVRADFAREDVVRSELPSSDVDGDIGDPASVDSGRTLQRNKRDLVRVMPYFSYDLTQRYRLDLDARYIDANFDRDFAGEQEDFSEFGAGVGIGFLTSQRSALTLRGLVSQYSTGFDADAYGAELEWTTDFSPTSRFYVRGGMQQTEPERGSSESSFIAGVGGRWSSQRNRFLVDLTRSISPNSGGTIVERHQFRVRLDHDVSQRVTWLVGARASRDEAIDGISAYPKREYISADTGVEWRVMRTLSLTATYNYIWQEYADEPSDKSANGVLLGVIYEPKRVD